jgi:hypothetical protein
MYQCIRQASAIAEKAITPSPRLARRPAGALRPTRHTAAGVCGGS